MPRKSNAPILVILAAGLAALLWLVGCGASNPYGGGSLERATTFRESGKNLEAVEAFGMFLRRNPTDSLAAWAQMERGNCYMDLKEYPLAAVEYQILRQEYPTSDLVEEAYYREASAYLAQVGDIRRDISTTDDARVRLLNFLDVYPQSVFSPDARDALLRISDIVAEKMLGSADTYARMGEPQAAAIVLDRLLRDEPNTRLRDKVLYERARVALKLEDEETARTMLGDLLAKFPESGLVGKSERLLARLDDDPS